MFGKVANDHDNSLGSLIHLVNHQAVILLFRIAGQVILPFRIQLFNGKDTSAHRMSLHLTWPLKCIFGCAVDLIYKILQILKFLMFSMFVQIPDLDAWAGLET